VGELDRERDFERRVRERDRERTTPVALPSAPRETVEVPSSQPIVTDGCG
jgi:hypothetical protein